MPSQEHKRDVAAMSIGKPCTVTSRHAYNSNKHIPFHELGILNVMYIFITNIISHKR